MPFSIKYTGNAHRTIPEHKLEWFPLDGKRVQKGIKNVELVKQLLTYPRPEFELTSDSQPSEAEITKLSELMNMSADVIKSLVENKEGAN